MTGKQKVYPDTREGLFSMLRDWAAGFGEFENTRWGEVRDVVGPWLDAHDENIREAALEERAQQSRDRTPPAGLPADAHARLAVAVEEGGSLYTGWLHDLRTVLGYARGGA